MIGLFSDLSKDLPHLANDLYKYSNSTLNGFSPMEITLNGFSPMEKSTFTKLPDGKLAVDVPGLDPDKLKVSLSKNGDSIVVEYPSDYYNKTGVIGERKVYTYRLSRHVDRENLKVDYKWGQLIIDLGERKKELPESPIPVNIL